MCVTGTGAPTTVNLCHDKTYLGVRAQSEGGDAKWRGDARFLGESLHLLLEFTSLSIAGCDVALWSGFCTDRNGSNAAFMREVPPYVYVPLGFEVCAHFCCSVLAITPKANIHKRNTTRRLLLPNAGNRLGFFYFFSKPRDLLMTSVLYVWRSCLHWH